METARRKQATATLKYDRGQNTKFSYENNTSGKLVV